MDSQGASVNTVSLMENTTQSQKSQNEYKRKKRQATEHDSASTISQEQRPPFQRSRSVERPAQKNQV